MQIHKSAPLFRFSSFLGSTFDQILSYRSSLPARKVIDFKSPDQLSREFDLSIPETPTSDPELLSLNQKVIDFSVHPTHSHFFNTLFSGSDDYSLAADFTTSSLNGVMYSYEMAPLFNLMEAEILKNHKALVGWEEAEGIFSPGGSIANLYGLLLARHHCFPEMRQEGSTRFPALAVFTSELGHYSIEKASVIAGIGQKNIYKIETDEKGRLIPSALEEAISQARKQGKAPFFVNATLGTTVFGAMDPVETISEICRRNGLWLHVDASFGGSLLFLPERRQEFIKGTQHADSIVFDPHKVLEIPLQCSIFMTRHLGLLRKCNAAKADYLFMEDKTLYDAGKLDLGDLSIQCGRHIDVYKYWIYLKAHGLHRIREKLRSALDNSLYLASLAKAHPNFELILDPEFLAVNFFFLPERVLKMTRDAAFWEEVGKAAPKLKERMIRGGSLMVAYQQQRQKNRVLRNFFRPVVTVNKRREDMEFIIEEMVRLGRDL